MDARGNSQAAGNALHELRLARTELAGERDDESRKPAASPAFAQGLGFRRTV